MHASLGPAITTLVGVALFLVGGTWDVSWHIVAGREGFWSAPHLVLYAGVIVVFASGALGLAHAWRRRVAPSPGAVISATGAAVALASAPLDDFWHQVYGLDVTIWSPPHLLLVGGVALAAFSAIATAARAHRHPVLPAPWLAFDAPWSAATGTLVAGVGILVATGGATAAEFDFDVARLPVSLHPPVLAGIVAFGLGLAARASRRTGGAILGAAAYTLVRVAIDWVQRGLAMPRPDIPLVLVGALAFEGVIALARHRWPGRTPGALVAAVAGACLAVALLVVQWPYTAALAGSVWGPSVILAGGLPAIAIAAAGAAGGWATGRRVADLVVGPAAVPDGPAARTRWSEVIVVAAMIGLAGSGIAPAIARAGAARDTWHASPSSAAPIVGHLEVLPAVPVVGQPVTLRLTLTDPSLLQTVGRAPAIPFESPRAGDVAEGVLSASGSHGTFATTFVPREAGRRWVSTYLPGEFGRVAVSAGFNVYEPGQVARATQAPSRPAVLRPEPGPDEMRPDWLEPVAIAGITVVLGAAALLTAWAIRRTA